MKEKKVRLFIAIDLPEAVLPEIERIQKELKKADLFEGRYTKPEQVHITMKFIGEVDTDQSVAIENALQQIVLKPYQAQLGGVDVFTMGNKIKIVYLNIMAPRLAQLAQKLEQIVQPWCEPEEHVFVSHATIARVKEVKDNQRLLGFLRRLEVESITFMIDTFVLKESVLLPDGPEYKVVREYELK